GLVGQRDLPLRQGGRAEDRRDHAGHGRLRRCQHPARWPVDMSMAITRHAWIAAALLFATSAAARDLRDPYLGGALCSASQGQYFEALERLDTEVAQHYRVDEPQRDSLQVHIKTAEFDVGDFELRYRMPQRAGRAIKAVIEGDVDETVRNDAIYRLGRVYFQKGPTEGAPPALPK